ncbi:hypothetical protein [Leekyejoonella antrihumi]|uniref:Uncharacterized protein n=1 Tax=Leekyejoonella antrihumi TaxID=1660198 RepID=A0A563E4S1_9MICO|nr:hypothetical protein [Leekyejoonella antrihumi]TWP37405.1 hypothetical protein FGL98_06565 [Leekyejoonella antrihumi]
MSDQLLHITIDVTLAEDQIHGLVGDGVAQPTPFRGWLALIGQLDEMLGSVPRPVAATGDLVPSEEEQ